MRYPSSFRGLCQSVYNVHFDLTKHLERQLQFGSKLHLEDKKVMTNFIMGALGESPWMRKNTDQASQYFNKFLKDYVIKPTSEMGLSYMEVANRQELINTSIELERKRRRFPLRELSTLNPFALQENKESLVETHCAVIVKEAAKILQTNVRNMLRSQGFDAQDIKGLVDEQLPLDHDAVTISNTMFKEKDLEETKRFLKSQNIDCLKIEEAFGHYQTICCEAQSKRQHFQTKIEHIESLKETYGEENIKYEFSKVRLLYAVEWVARAKMVGKIYDYMPEVFALGQDETPMNFVGDYNKVEESFNEFKGLLGKQMLTTILGASINSSSRDKAGRNGKYMIACDTEFHDYAKFPIRVVLTLLAGMVASNISLGSELGKDGQEVTEDFVRFASRFISGSHIAMRTLPENVMDLTKELLSMESLKTDRLGLDPSEIPVGFDSENERNIMLDKAPSSSIQPNSIESMLIVKQFRSK